MFNLFTPVSSNESNRLLRDKLNYRRISIGFSYDLLEDRCLDDSTINKILLSYHLNE